jgi:hypothetical protein
MTGERIQWMLIGIAALLVVKYGIVGLMLWDRTLHPDRQDNPSGQFYYPLLGALGTNF